MVTEPTHGRSGVHRPDGGACELSRSPGFHAATAPQDPPQCQAVLQPSPTPPFLSGARVLWRPLEALTRVLGAGGAELGPQQPLPPTGRKGVPLWRPWEGLGAGEGQMGELVCLETFWVVDGGSCGLKGTSAPFSSLSHTLGNWTGPRKSLQLDEEMGDREVAWDQPPRPGGQSPGAQVGRGDRAPCPPTGSPGLPGFILSGSSSGKHLVLGSLYDTLLTEKVLAGVVAWDSNPVPGRAVDRPVPGGAVWGGVAGGWPHPVAVGWTFRWGWTCIRDVLGRAALGVKIVPTCRRQSHTRVTQEHQSTKHGPQEGWLQGRGSWSGPRLACGLESEKATGRRPVIVLRVQVLRGLAPSQVRAAGGRVLGLRRNRPPECVSCGMEYELCVASSAPTPPLHTGPAKQPSGHAEGGCCWAGSPRLGEA